MKKLYTVSKNKIESWLWIRSWTPYCKFRLKVKKVGKNTRSFRYCYSVAKSYPAFCDPMNYSTSGFPVLHYLQELLSISWVSNAIQPFHPLSSPSPPAINLSQHHGLSQWAIIRIRWPKYWSFSISPSNECSGLISFRIDWFDVLVVQGTVKSLLHHNLKASILWH